MKLKTLKFTLAVGSIFVWVYCLILTDVCLLSRRECFPNPTKFKTSIIVSLDRLSFQKTLDTHDYEENVVDLPRGLNRHIWQGHCVTTIEALCNFPVFPKAPDERQVILRTEITAPDDAGIDGQRLFGYLFLNTTGKYQFAVASNGFAELWLSLSKNWRAAKKIAFIRPFDVQSTITKWEFGASKTQISSGIYLKAGRRYYMEILHTFGTRNISENFLQVAWKRPEKSNFVIIESESLSVYTNDSEKGKYKMFDDELPNSLSCLAINKKDDGNRYMKPETLLYLEYTSVNETLDSCEYRPSYLVDPANLFSFKRYEGVRRHIHKMYSFPYAIVDSVAKDKAVRAEFYAESLLDEEEAWSVVYRYMDALQKRYAG